jgi:metal-responsive CopG/Arc/MetJ family transcriptional regulator
MSLQINEPKETFAKNVVFWVRPSLVRRLDAICNSSHIDRSEVLRALVEVFVDDYTLQNRIMEIVRKNHV